MHICLTIVFCTRLHVCKHLHSETQDPSQFLDLLGGEQEASQVPKVLRNSPCRTSLDLVALIVLDQFLRALDILRNRLLGEYMFARGQCCLDIFGLAQDWESNYDGLDIGPEKQVMVGFPGT